MIAEGRKNLSASSERHCLRIEAGRMRRMRRWPEAQSWERTMPASIVLPRPTSSEECAAGDRGGKSEDRGVDLMGIEVDLGAGEAVRDAAKGRAR